MGHFKKFYTCPSCGKAISGEKTEYFTCPDCGRALCRRENLEDFTDNFCGHCGADVASAKAEALAAEDN